MTAATANQRELVKLLYIEHGHQKASELSGVRYDLVRKWASLGHWKQLHKPSQTPVAIATERLVDELADNERETRLSLSRYARRAAQDSEQATLRDAPLVHKAAQVAGIAHRWGSDEKPSHFTLNMLNINSLVVDTPEQQA